jgi:cobalt-precorrin-5B (C1)-methyltransferase
MEQWKADFKLSEEKKSLRKGFSTGACATAAAKAAWNLSLGKEAGENIDILFPDGIERAMTLEFSKSSGKFFKAGIIKDAGDDPDVTDKSLISVKLSKINETDIRQEDYILEHNEGVLVLRGGDGVGLSTKPGLEVPPGKWAINPGPRKMILNNLSESGFGETHETFLLEISVANGSEIAKKTLNPTLGIVGGISILGNTGIVEPHSHAAYIETVGIMLKHAKSEGLESVVLCTGAATKKASAKEFPELPDFAFIRIGDFIADALEECEKHGFKTIIVSCMMGKLFKYSMGYEYTHAHTVKLEPSDIIRFLDEAGVENDLKQKAAKSLTIRGAMEILNENDFKAVLELIGREALKNIKSWSGKADAQVLCFSADKKLLSKWKSD